MERQPKRGEVRETQSWHVKTERNGDILVNIYYYILNLVSTLFII